MYINEETIQKFLKVIQAGIISYSTWISYKYLQRYTLKTQAITTIIFNNKNFFSNYRKDFITV